MSKYDVDEFLMTGGLTERDYLIVDEKFFHQAVDGQEIMALCNKYFKILEDRGKRVMQITLRKRNADLLREKIGAIMLDGENLWGAELYISEAISNKIWFTAKPFLLHFYDEKILERFELMDI